MITHRYLRAYMAGIVFPTIVIAFAIIVFFVARHMFHLPIPIERLVIFPMALVPSLFGLWNMLYMRLSAGRYLPLGLHGALLPLILIPLGMTGAVALEFLSLDSRGATWFNTATIPYLLIVPWFAIVMIIYYLVWKYLIGFCNRVLEIA
jgi:hypothetical protein